MKILMVNSFYYLRGGAERCFFELSQLFTRAGHEVVPFAMTHERNLPTSYADYFADYINFPELLGEGAGPARRLRAAAHNIYSSQVRARVERLIAAVRPDIAHVHCYAHELSPSVLDGIKGSGVPLVHTIHDFHLICPNTNFLSHNQVCERCKGHRYYNAVLCRCKHGSLAASALAAAELYVHHWRKTYAHTVDVSIAPSRFLQRKLAEHGITGEVVYVPNFVDLTQFTPRYEPADYIAYAGRLLPEKGVDVLIEAMRALPEVPLLIAGEGALRERLEAKVAAYGLQRVTFLGHLAKEELLRVVQGARCMVVPSLVYENNPMAILEAFACGTPVVGSDLGGIAELVGDGDVGLRFQAGNAAELAACLRAIIADPARALLMGRNARRQVEIQNHPARHYEQTLAIYHRLIKGRRPAYEEAG